MPPYIGASAKLRQYSRRPSAKSAGLDQSGRSVLRSEISWLTRKHVSQPRGHSDKRLNRGTAELASSPFRHFAVSPFRSSCQGRVFRFGKRLQSTFQTSFSISSASRAPLIKTARFDSRVAR